MLGVFLELVQVLCLFVYYWLEAIVLAILPSSFQSKDVKGQKVLVTGSGSGIGRLISYRFADLGCELILWDVNREGNEETAKGVRARGGKVHTYVCDLSNREKVYETANKVKVDVGDIDILVNNAGIVTGRKFLDCPDGLIQKTMEVNTMAHFWTVKAFLPSMLTRNHGHVVNIASAAGIVGVASLADYCASKFGAVGFDESLRAELHASGKHGVKTTVVCPFYINTGMFEGVKSRFEWILPLIDPDYAANKIVDAVLTDQQILYMPRVLYIILALKGLLPVKAAHTLNDFFGASRSMDSFVGRSKSK